MTFLSAIVVIRVKVKKRKVYFVSNKKILIFIVWMDKMHLRMRFWGNGYVRAINNYARIKKINLFLSKNLIYFMRNYLNGALLMMKILNIIVNSKYKALYNYLI